MPDETPNGLAGEQTPGPTADTSETSGMPAEVAAFVAGMNANLGDLASTKLEGARSAETPGNDDDHDDGQGRREGPGADDGGGDDPTTGGDGTTDSTSDGSDQTTESGGDDGLPSDLPEKVRQALKDLPRSVKRDLFGHVKTTVKAEVQAEVETAQQTAARLQQEQADAEAERQRIRGKFDGYVGAGKADMQLKDRQGNVIGVRPSYETVRDLLNARNGDDILEDKYGLSREEAFDWRDELEMRREALPTLAEEADTQAWGKLGYFTLQGLRRVEGLDADATLAATKSPDQIIDKVREHLTAHYEGKLAAQARTYEARIEGLSKNGEALKGRATAAEAKQLDRGGRPGPGGRLTAEQARQMMKDPVAFQKNKQAIYDALGI